MTNQEIENKLRGLIQNEREITNEILSLIGLADQRRIFVEKGYGSLFEWLVRGFGYSESAAQRRIQAARLIRAVPEISEKLSKGEVSLSSISKTQSMIRLHEVQSGEKLSDEQKSSVVKKIENKTSQETAKGRTIPRNRFKSKIGQKTAIDEETSRIALNISNETLKELKRIKELLSHALPHGTLGDVIQYLTKDFLKRRDPLKKPDIKIVKEGAASNTAATKRCVSVFKKPEAMMADGELLMDGQTSRRHSQPERRPSLPAALKRKVFQAYNGKCTSKIIQLGRIRGSSFQVEVDHIYPRALSGEDTFENLRCLCRAHNQFVGALVLGQGSLLQRQ